MYVMENLILSPESKKAIIDYIKECRLMQHEKAIMQEIIAAVNSADQTKLDWFSQFGPSLRHIHMNVHAYRKGLEFGFTKIEFGQYNWFARPEFLEKEDIILGNPKHYAEHSIIHLGRGPAGIWTYALNYNYGLAAGGGYALSVYGKQFPNRQDALMTGLTDLKEMMTKVIGHKDTTNYKQPIILSNLESIKKAQVNAVQLALF
jgi:hypothetical protein